MFRGAARIRAHISVRFSICVCTRQALYTLDQLYDYVVAALGPQLFGVEGRRWAEIDTALRRIPRESEQFDARVLKAIGLLSIVGDLAGVRASPNVLEAALSDGTPEGTKRVQQSLDALARSSAIVYRKYRDSFQIWEGSDLNLDDLVRAAADQTDTRADLPRRLTSLVPPRPVVARRHLFQTGTLRILRSALRRWRERSRQRCRAQTCAADGALLIALAAFRWRQRTPARDGRAEDAVVHCDVGSDEAGRVGVPRNASHLADLAAEMAALEWVQSNTPDLARDPVARRELGARLEEAERLVRDEVRASDGRRQLWCLRLVLPRREAPSEVGCGPEPLHVSDCLRSCVQ
jgi:hypothetical protein